MIKIVFLVLGCYLVGSCECSAIPEYRTQNVLPQPVDPTTSIAESEIELKRFKRDHPKLALVLAFNGGGNGKNSGKLETIQIRNGKNCDPIAIGKQLLESVNLNGYDDSESVEVRRSKSCSGLRQKYEELCHNIGNVLADNQKHHSDEINVPPKIESCEAQSPTIEPSPIPVPGQPKQKPLSDESLDEETIENKSENKSNPCTNQSNVKQHDLDSTENKPNEKYNSTDSTPKTKPSECEELPKSIESKSLDLSDFDQSDLSILIKPGGEIDIKPKQHKKNCRSRNHNRGDHRRSKCRNKSTKPSSRQDSKSRRRMTVYYPIRQYQKSKSCRERRNKPKAISNSDSEQVSNDSDENEGSPESKQRISVESDESYYKTERRNRKKKTGSRCN